MRSENKKYWRIMERDDSSQESEAGRFSVSSTYPLTIGRSSKMDVVVARENVAISRHQFDLAIENGVYKLTNTGRHRVRFSSGERVAPDSSVWLQDGLTCVVGKTRICFRAPAQDIAEQVEYSLQFFVNGKQIKDVPFSKPVFRIGSQSDNDIVLMEQGVSKHHMCVCREDDGTFGIHDSDSKNGVFVSDQEADEAVRVEHAHVAVGETFSFGTVAAKIEPQVEARGKRLKKVLYAGAALLLFALAIALLPNRRGVDSEVDDFAGQLKTVWRYPDFDDRYKALEALVNRYAGGQEELNALFGLLQAEEKVRDENNRLSKALKIFKKKVNADPWVPESYQTVNINPKMLEELTDVYADCLAQAPDMAGKLPLSAKDIATEREKGFLQTANKSCTQTRELIFEASKASVLSKWMETGVVDGQQVKEFSSVAEYILSDIAFEQVQSLLKEILQYNSAAGAAWTKLSSVVCSAVIERNIAIEPNDIPAFPIQPRGLPKDLRRSLEKRYGLVVFAQISSLLQSAPDLSCPMKRCMLIQEVLPLMEKVNVELLSPDVVAKLAEEQKLASKEITKQIKDIEEGLKSGTEALETSATVDNALSLCKLIARADAMSSDAVSVGSKNDLNEKQKRALDKIRDKCEDWYTTTIFKTNISEEAEYIWVKEVMGELINIYGSTDVLQTRLQSLQKWVDRNDKHNEQ